MQDEFGQNKHPKAVVFDCNLFLQAVGKGGNHAYRCLQLVVTGSLTLFMSEAVLHEIDEVLRRPIVRAAFPMLDDERVDDLIDWLRESAVFLDPVPHRFDYPRDPKDEPYIDLAIAGQAVFLVSWDKDLRDLADPNCAEGREFARAHSNVRVMDPKEFLAHFYSIEN